MSNSGGSFPKVGVQFVAQNAPQYIKTIAQANDGLAQYTERIKEATAAANASDGSAKKIAALTEQIAKDYRAAAEAVKIYQDQVAKGLRGGNLLGSQDFIDKTQDSLEKSTRSLEDFNTRVAQTGAGAGKLGDHFTSASSAIGASRVGVGLFTRELVQMVGGANVATQALESFVYATGTMGIALGVATAGLVLLKEGTKQASEEFEKHQQVVANTAKSYSQFELQRLKALQASPEGLATGVPAAVGAFAGAFVENFGKRAGDVWGQAFLLGVQGQLTPLKFAQIYAQGLQAFLSSPSDVLRAAQQKFLASQQEVATQQFVAGASNRVASAALADEIANLKLEGASYDTLIPKIYEYLRAKQAAGQFTGSGANGTITGSDVTNAIPSIDVSSQLAKRASDFANKLRQVYVAGVKEIEGIESDHQTRMGEIAASGYEQQVRIEREFLQRRAQIQAQYNQDVADAGRDYASRLADAETDAQDRRSKVVQDFADRREAIEQNYQERLAQIQSDYANSLFDIVARDDAKGLVRARLQRDRAIADAQRSRDKENADAQKQHDKQQKDIADALEKQKREINQAYEKQLRDLKQNYDKQNEQNGQSYRDQLSDLNTSLARQYAAEQDSYKKRRKAAEDQIAERRAALVAALVQDQNLTVEYAKAIIASLSSVLDPDRITQLVNDLQEALDTTISIKITPKGKGGEGSEKGSGGAGSKAPAGAVATPSQYGTPGASIGRTSMAQGSRVSASASAGKVTIYVDNNVNSALLDSQIRTTSLGVTTEVIRRGRGY